MKNRMNRLNAAGLALILDSIRLILENLAKEHPDAPRRDPKEFIDA
jgi:hypothetical protein